MAKKAIGYTVEFTIKPGRLDDFKKMADWFIERTEADEPGTKRYEWFMSADDTKCYLHEGFDDSKGLVAHAGGPNVQGHIGELLETCDITRFEAFGIPDKEATAVLEGFGAVTHRPLGGFVRS